MNLAERLADYAHGLSFEQLDEKTVHEVRRRLIDSLACALGAWRANAPGVARRIAARVSGTELGAGYPGSGSHRTSPDLAAFVYGILFRYLDYNDTYLSLEPAHPSDNLAAVLSVAQAKGGHGKEIITAAVLAYEVQCRLCDAASIRANGWDHVTYGAFSTSLAAAKLLGLSPEAMVQAMNLAATPNNTLRLTRAGELSEWKGCAFANASRNGVFAALLAAEGLTGPSPIFEGEMGFCEQISGPLELPKLGGVNGEDFMINHTSIKFWPAEYHSQSAIHAALELREQIGDVSRIQALKIESFDAAVDIIGKDPEKWRPQTRETADHSLPYCTAVALMDGDVTLESFAEEKLHDLELLDLISRTTIERDAGLTARYPKGIPNRLIATLDDGSTVVAENEFPRGHDQNPMTDAEVTAKFMRMASREIDNASSEAILKCCWELESLEDVGELLALFHEA